MDVLNLIGELNLCSDLSFLDDFEQNLKFDLLPAGDCDLSVFEKSDFLSLDTFKSFKSFKLRLNDD